MTMITRIMMGNILLMLIGLPASGKTTFTNEILKDHPEFHVASLDQYLEKFAAEHKIPYDQAFLATATAGEKAMYEGVLEAVKDRKSIIWDQTNLTFKTRAKKLILIPEDYYKVAVVFPTPEDHDKWLASRPEKIIPAPIISAMRKTYQAPSHNEGFDLTTTIKAFDFNAISEASRHHTATNTGN